MTSSPPNPPTIAFFFGFQLALRGVPLSVIQQLMGHSDPKTTSIYTRAAGVELAGPLDEAGWLT